MPGLKQEQAGGSGSGKASVADGDVERRDGQDSLGYSSPRPSTRRPCSSPSACLKQQPAWQREEGTDV